jgi:hypothetical protein
LTLPTARATFASMKSTGFVAGAMALGACGADPATSESLLHRQLVEEIRIGNEADRDFQFTAVSQVAVYDAFVFVRQRGEQEIRVFGFDGRHRRNIGRRGSGPGEFVGLEVIGVLGDTLWAIDGDVRRITLFRLDGSVIATIAVTGLSTSTGADRGRYFPYPKTMTGNGSVLGTGGWFGSDMASGATTSEPLWRACAVRYGRGPTASWATPTRRTT